MPIILMCYARFSAGLDLTPVQITDNYGPGWKIESGFKPSLLLLYD